MTTKKSSVKKKVLSKRERIAQDNTIYKKEHEEYLKEVANCEHICTSNCRRNGCDCVCGEYCQRPELSSIKSRFANKDFSRFAPVTALPYEIDGEPAIQGCSKFTATVVAIVLLGIVVYAMHGDYQAVTGNLIN